MWCVCVGVRVCVRVLGVLGRDLRPQGADGRAGAGPRLAGHVGPHRAQVGNTGDDHDDDDLLPTLA